MSNNIAVTKAAGLNGEIEIPGDKSISHRAVIFGSLAEGKTTIENFLMGEDCLSTIDCFRNLGVSISVDGERVAVTGVGKKGLQEPRVPLNANNSGTTMRLMLGVLAGQDFHSVLIGDSSLSKRPMLRVAEPLKKLGAKIDGRNKGENAPISIRGGQLKSISYQLPVASAQLKSAILLGGLNAAGKTQVIETEVSRNHTEIMLKYFGAEIEVNDKKITIDGSSKLTGQHVVVPGDISSAAFFMVAGLIIPDSDILIKNVGINPTRDGIITVLREMGGQIELLNERIAGGEPVADLRVKSSSLQGVSISGDIIPKLIDEIPVISIAATQAEGETVITDAAELKVKESNRLNVMVNHLTKLGVKVEELSDGMKIEGKKELNSDVELESYGDHRIAMAMIIAGLVNRGKTVVDDISCIDISFPNFLGLINKLRK